MLGALIERRPRELKQAATAELTTLWHMTQTFAIDKKHNLPKHWPSESQSQWKNRLCQRMKLYQPDRLKPAINFDHRNSADYRQSILLVHACLCRQTYERLENRKQRYVHQVSRSSDEQYAKLE